MGANIVQLSRALGHHSSAFTLTVYTHLLPGDEAPALDLADALSKVATRGGNVPHGPQEMSESVDQAAIAA